MLRVEQSPIRLAIIGCGAIARIAHAKALTSLPQFDVKYLCDINSKQAKALRREFDFDATVTDDLGALEGNIDAAIVCVWPRDHVTVTANLLRMGVDVLCEKPVAMTSGDAREVAALARDLNRVLGVGHWCRGQKGAWILRRLLSVHFLGRISETVAEFGNLLSWPMSSGSYYDRSVTAGGVMFDAGIHVVDLVMWLFGDLDVTEYRDDSFGGVETNGIMEGVLTQGEHLVRCRIAASWTHAQFNGIRVVGDQGTAELRFREPNHVTVRRNAGDGEIVFDVNEEGCEIPFRSPVAQVALLEDFASAIRARGLPLTTAESAAASLATIERAYALRRPLEQPWVEPWNYGL